MHETLLPLPIHWFQEVKLTLVYLFWMPTVRAIRTPLFCLLLQILSFKSAWGHCSEEQLYSEKHIPQKADIMQVTDTVEMDYNLFLPLKSAGKHYPWHWKENGIWQRCSFLVFFFSFCHILLSKGSPKPLMNKARELNFLLGLKARCRGLSGFC